MSSTPSEETKCPCCDNPWSRATGDLFAKLCTECKISESSTAEFGINRNNLDPAVDQHANFYQWANGGWMKANTIPPGYPSWNTFTALHVQSQERCKTLLDQLANKNKTDNDKNSQRIATFWKASMDEEAIEAHGIQPLEPILAHIDAIVEACKASSAVDYAKLLGELPAKYGVYPFFSTGASPDSKNSDLTILQVSQGGLGLPDRDYYFDEDKKDKREAYIAHVAKMLGFLGMDDDDAAAQKVFDLEERMAQNYLTRTENRDPQTTYNKMSIADLTTNIGGDQFDFAAYFAGSTGKTTEQLADINVRQTKAMTALAEIISTVDPVTLGYYLRFHAIHSYASYLSKAIVEEHFDFYERTLSGTQEMKPRWKRAMAFIESALGEALGEQYCAEYFDESCKEKALEIVESVRQALESRLMEVDWIKADSTREEALKKMSKFRVKIGYPNKWIDYSKLTFDDDASFVAMVIQARAFEHQREVEEMNAPTDREKWFMTPQTVNAYYHPNLNEIVFPAAILQHPFFDPQADDAVNFGAMGAVIGHEMTHGFDDKGRKFNFAGELRDWWTEDDAKEYEARVDVMVEQANQFQVHGKNVQGKLTSGENIADLGGLRLSYRALTSRPDFDDTKLIDGFTPTQRFFLSWAQCWRQNIEKERSLQLLTLDPHGPNEMRCNGPLSNIPDFHRAFAVPEGSAMYKPVEIRVDIW